MLGVPDAGEAELVAELGQRSRYCAGPRGSRCPRAPGRGRGSRGAGSCPSISASCDEAPEGGGLSLCPPLPPGHPRARGDLRFVTHGIAANSDSHFRGNDAVRAENGGGTGAGPPERRLGEGEQGGLAYRLTPRAPWSAPAPAARTGGGRCRRRRGPAASCVPSSTIRPLSNTSRRSSARTVDSRWAMTIVVRPTISRSIACWISTSDSESRLEVASSRIRIGASARKARAMATRWRSPPESLTPRSPTMRLVALGQRLDEVVGARELGRLDRSRRGVAPGRA